MTTPATSVIELMERLSDVARLAKAADDAVAAYNANWNASKAAGHIGLSEEGHRLWRVSEDAKRDHLRAALAFSPLADEAASSLAVLAASADCRLEVTDEMITAFAVGAQMGNGQFTSDDANLQRALDNSKARVKAGLEEALLAAFPAGRDWKAHVARAIVVVSRLNDEAAVMEAEADAWGEGRCDWETFYCVKTGQALAALKELRPAGAASSG